MRDVHRDRLLRLFTTARVTFGDCPMTLPYPLLGDVRECMRGRFLSREQMERVAAFNGLTLADFEGRERLFVQDEPEPVSVRDLAARLKGLLAREVRP